MRSGELIRSGERRIFGQFAGAETSDGAETLAGPENLARAES